MRTDLSAPQVATSGFRTHTSIPVMAWFRVQGLGFGVYGLGFRFRPKPIPVMAWNATGVGVKRGLVYR